MELVNLDVSFVKTADHYQVSRGHRLIRVSDRLTCLSSFCPAPRLPPMTLSVLVSGRCDPNTNLQTSEVEKEEVGEGGGGGARWNAAVLDVLH